MTGTHNSLVVSDAAATALVERHPPTYPNEMVNILIVDDEPRNLTVLETVLDQPWYRLVKAESAEQALLAILADEFAVLILDIHMPGTTGFELAQMIRQRKKTSNVPIIFLTAYFNDDEHVIEGYDSGAVDYLHKPINPAILRSKVTVLVELHLKQRQLESTNRALLAEVMERRLIQEQLRDLNETLEQRVIERTEAHRMAEQHVRLLMNEVNHRSKNILSVVMAIAQQTVASNPKEFFLQFSNRIRALSLNHDLLVKSYWKKIGMADLIEGQLAHFEDLMGRRVVAEGPPILLSATAAQSIGMVVHELSTNAIKHGALVSVNGRINIAWGLELSEAGERFNMSWTERHGPPVVAPTSRGFGTTVVTRMIEMSMDGKTEVLFEPEGLIWRLSCPAYKLDADNAIAADIHS